MMAAGAKHTVLGAQLLTTSLNYQFAKRPPPTHSLTNLGVRLWPNVPLLRALEPISQPLHQERVSDGGVGWLRVCVWLVGWLVGLSAGRCVCVCAPSRVCLRVCVRVFVSWFVRVCPVLG